jgi:hypothetical protein
MSSQPPAYAYSTVPAHRRGSLDSERHLNDAQFFSAPHGDGAGTWAPGLDPIADGHDQWVPEDGPSAWDPQLDPSRGRE